MRCFKCGEEIEEGEECRVCEHYGVGEWSEE